ncbi:MAG TPA: copper resistance protein CopC [Chloroflexota bacterium]|nr:copper resistance protein CopC [Chloroflexota bacterium]
MTRSLLAVACSLAVLAGSTGLASAHANLVRSNVKNNQVFRYGHTPRQIDGFFAENLLPKSSWMAVFEGVADHGMVSVKHSHVNFQNPKEMVLPLPRLARGKYYFIWYTKSADDNHIAAGIVYFRVR